MPPVTSVSRLPEAQVRLLVWAGLLLATLGARAGDLTLDLTETRPPDDAFPIVTNPVAAVGGIGEVPPPGKLPLELTIEDIFPRSPSVSTDTVEVRLLVRNIGKEAVSIPASTHHLETGRAGNRNRVQMFLSLELTVPQDPRRTIFGPGLSTLGSSDVAGSMLTIAPGQSVHIRLATKFGNISDWISLGPGLYQAKATASLWEHTIEDDRLAEKSHTAKVVSTNSILLSVSWKP